MAECFDAGEDLDESAERGRVLHDTFVDAADLRLLYDRFDDLTRLFAGLSGHRGDRD